LLGHEVDDLTPPGAKVKNAWSFIFTSPCLHGMVHN